MYFSSLRIENIKCFHKEQVLDLKDGNGKLSNWTLILGENGVGKTTLLKCLSWMVPVEAPLKEDEIEELTEKAKGDGVPIRVDIKPYMDDFDNEDTYDQLIRIGDDVKAKITATLTNNVSLGEVPNEDQEVTISMSFERIKGKLEIITPERDTIDMFNSPNLFAYSASRHLAFKNIENTEFKDPTSNLFSESGELYDAEQLLSMLDNAARRHGDNSKAAMLLVKVKNILVDLLPDIKHPDNIFINSPIREDGSINPVLVEVKTDDGKVKLLDLSLGYKTMLSWIVDLAVRMLWHHPDQDEPLKQPAVVIIDEVDLHLHPIWQRTIREKLTGHFENTQFICTAHSPFMAQSSEEENLCVINRRDGDIEIQNEPLIVKGWRIGQIATSELFNVPSERSPDIEALRNERWEILDKAEKSPADLNRLKELDLKLNELPVEDNPEDQQLINQIRETTEFLRSQGKLS